MPKSLRCKIKKLCYNGTLTERERDRILKALEQEPREEDIHREREQAYMLGYEDASKKFRTEPSEDCISRQAVIDAINFEDEWLFDAKSHNADTNIAFSAIKSKISELPSITPRRDLAETSQDCISREEVQDLISRWLSDYLLDETREALETINYKIGDMPSVTPQRPKGKWIEIEIDAGEFIYKCTKCGMRVINPYKYCPICGAEMNGGGEDG